MLRTLPPARCPAKPWPTKPVYNKAPNVSHNWMNVGCVCPVLVCLSCFLVMMEQSGSYSLYYCPAYHPQITLHMAKEGKDPVSKYQVQFSLNYTAGKSRKMVTLSCGKSPADILRRPNKSRKSELVDEAVVWIWEYKGLMLGGGALFGGECMKPFYELTLGGVVPFYTDFTTQRAGVIAFIVYINGKNKENSLK